MNRNFILLFLFVLVVPSQTLAHKLSSCAYYEEGGIHVEAMFSDGKMCAECEVKFFDQQGEDELLRGQTDADGLFKAVLTPRLNAAEGLKIIVDGKSGHLSECFLAKEEYFQKGDLKSLGHDVSEVVAAGVSAEQLSAVVKEAVSKELAPIKRLLLQDKGTSLRDVVGGIGYLVGFAGLIAYIRSLRRKG